MPDRSTRGDPHPCPFGCDPETEPSDAWMLVGSVLTIVRVLVRNPGLALALAVVVGLLGEMAGWW